MALDGLCVIASGYAAYYVRRLMGHWSWSMDIYVFTLSVLIVMAVSNYTMGKLQLYSDKRPSGYFKLYAAIGKALLPAFGILIFAIFVFQHKEYSRLFIICFASFSFLSIALVRTVVIVYFEKYAGRRFNRHQILLVGDRETGKLVMEMLQSQLSWGHKIVGRLSVDSEPDDTCENLGCIENLAEIIKGHTIDEVVFAINGHRGVDLLKQIDICKKMGVFIRILPSLWCTENRHFSFDICQRVPFLTIGAHNFNATGLLYKRLLDITGGLVGTILLLLMFPFVAAAIKLDSPGSIIFKQLRVGQNGRKFNLYKFRSMYADAEQRFQDLQADNEMNGAIFKIKHDPRITKVGRWLRKTSLDEFPQFVNVLKGEMSLVGTRPPTCQEVALYNEEQLKRISFKPGLTGLWQVSGRNKITDFNKIVELDCLYLDHWRFLDDLKILARTVWVVLQRKGAI